MSARGPEESKGALSSELSPTTRTSCAVIYRPYLRPANCLFKHNKTAVPPFNLRGALFRVRAPFRFPSFLPPSFLPSLHHPVNVSSFPPHLLDLSLFFPLFILYASALSSRVFIFFFFFEVFFFVFLCFFPVVLFVSLSLAVALLSSSLPPFFLFTTNEFPSTHPRFPAIISDYTFAGFFEKVPLYIIGVITSAVIEPRDSLPCYRGRMSNQRLLETCENPRRGGRSANQAAAFLPKLVDEAKRKRHSGRRNEDSSF
ncbi:hypothetical protein ANTRET_LOCUS9173, partial [Anthophora retusa]